MLFPCPSTPQTPLECESSVTSIIKRSAKACTLSTQTHSWPHFIHSLLRERQRERSGCTLDGQQRRRYRKGDTVRRYQKNRSGKKEQRQTKGQGLRERQGRVEQNKTLGRVTLLTSSFSQIHIQGLSIRPICKALK